MEWRWLHDREALVAEVQADAAEREAQRAREAAAQKPRRMMPLPDFWRLIALLDWDHEGDDDAVLAPVVEALAALPKTDIRGFQERLTHLLYLIDTRAHALASGLLSEKDDYLSVDAFLFARCVVVANGQAFYDDVLAKPQTMPQDMEFEALLQLASAAWEQKTDGDDFDHETGCSYETYSNQAGWTTETAREPRGPQTAPCAST